jgi:hypothetical protein
MIGSVACADNPWPIPADIKQKPRNIAPGLFVFRSAPLLLVEAATAGRLAALARLLTD